MKNKLGINEFRLNEIERKIVNLKLNMLDETFTFNRKELNLDYLISLNKFLFNDFYCGDESVIRNLSANEVEIINKYLKNIIIVCVNDPENIEIILSLIEEIWHLQPFIVGNTRTLIAYLKILSKCFLLEIEVNVNKEITSKPDMFNLNNFVNRKGLTKIK